MRPPVRVQPASLPLQGPPQLTATKGVGAKPASTACNVFKVRVFYYIRFTGTDATEMRVIIRVVTTSTLLRDHRFPGSSLERPRDTVMVRTTPNRSPPALSHHSKSATWRRRDDQVYSLCGGCMRRGDYLRGDFTPTHMGQWRRGSFFTAGSVNHESIYFIAHCAPLSASAHAFASAAQAARRETVLSAILSSSTSGLLLGISIETLLRSIGQ